jgi:hypothetical protein
VEVEEPQDDDDDDDEAGEEEGDGEGDDRGSPMEAVSATERGRRDGEALGAAELHRPDGFASKAPALVWPRVEVAATACSRLRADVPASGVKRQAR